MRRLVPCPACRRCCSLAAPGRRRRKSSRSPASRRPASSSRRPRPSWPASSRPACRRLPRRRQATPAPTPQAQKLYFFYGARHFEPLWLIEGADGKVAFSPSADKIMDVFKDAAARRLPPVRLPDARPRPRRRRHRSRQARGRRDRVLRRRACATRRTPLAAASTRLEVSKLSTITPQAASTTAEMLMQARASSDDPDQILLRTSTQAPRIPARSRRRSPSFDDGRRRAAGRRSPTASCSSPA